MIISQDKLTRVGHHGISRQIFLIPSEDVGSIEIYVYTKLGWYGLDGISSRTMY